MNPEFRRNLWLELPVQRLIAMPVVLLLVFVAADAADGASGVQKVASVTLKLLLLLWGSRLAADSVLGEVAGRTWDGQRLSALGPWSMVWGKLFGGTIFVWYGAALCVPAWLIGPDAGPRGLAEVLVAGLFTQAVALLASLLLLRSRPERLRFRVTLAQILALLATLAFVLPSFAGPDTVVAWYGRDWMAEDFGLATQGLFLVWAVAGSYRLMRTELQFPPGLLPWLLFVLFLAFYAGGFDGLELPGSGADPAFASLARRGLAAAIAAIAATYAAVLLEPKSVVALRRWRRALGERRIGAALGLTPGWLAAFLVAAVLAALTAASVPALTPFLLAMLLFLVRDIGVIHLLTLDARPRRGSLGVLVYLAVIYVACPQATRIPGFEGLQPLFMLLPGAPPGALLTAVAGPAAEAALVLALLFFWNRRRAP